MLPEILVRHVGKLQLNIYIFHNKNDELPLHDHDEETKHITMVNKGKIMAYGPEHNWEKIMEPGNIVTFAPNNPHAFVALEDDTKITSIVY